MTDLLSWIGGVVMFLFGATGMFILVTLYIVIKEDGENERRFK